MAYIVTDACQSCTYTDCVVVCPVDCFYDNGQQLVIDYDECIDCGACEPECPSTAIYEEGELPDEHAAAVDWGVDAANNYNNVNEQRDPRGAACS